MGPDGLQIYIFGDLEFAYFILNGVTMLFTSEASYIQAAMILSILFLMWAFIKWSMNPEKTTYPVREFAMGIILFLIFGGTAVSPKFQVTLVSANTGAARIVTDVPLLAAIPSWLATNLFKKMTDTLETGGFFVIPGYENLRNYGSPVDNEHSDPLTAIVKLQNIVNTKLVSAYKEQNIKNYIEQCYVPIKTMQEKKDLSFLDVPIYDNVWSELQVSSMYFKVPYITITGGTETTTEILCQDAYSLIATDINITAAPSSTDDSFGAVAVKAVTARDVTANSIQRAAKIINQNLTGAPADPNPYTITTNMFLSTTIKDVISQTSLGTWSQKMVFEAERKRTFESIGEKALFEKIYIPTITAVETFSFYIAPILMMLSVLGGVGFGLIGKYLMLVLFINLWSFIKVFVDIFTALSLQRAFQVADGDIQNLPLSVANYANSILEVEALLTVASNLTMAIPFFAMFLLYGGIHSVMGVMRTVTGGSVDGSNMAPTMATSMNAGALTQGDYTNTHILSTGHMSEAVGAGAHARYGQTMTSGGASTSFQGAQSTALAQVRNQQSSFNSALESAWLTSTSSSNANQSGTTQTAASTQGVNYLDSLVDSTSGTHSYSQGQSAQVLSRLAATLGAKVAAGGNLGSGDPEQAQEAQKATSGSNRSKDTLKKGLMSLGISADVAGQMIGSMTESDVNTFSQQAASARQQAKAHIDNGTYSQADMNSKVDSYVAAAQNSNGYKEVETTAQTLANSRQLQASLGANFDSTGAYSNSQSLAWGVLASSGGGFGYQGFEQMYNSLDKPSQERLSQLGLGSDALSVARSLSAGDDKMMHDGTAMMQGLLKQLSKQDENIQTTAQDSRISASILDYASTRLTGSDYQPAFASAAGQHRQLADTIDTHIGKENQIPATSTPRAELVHENGNQMPAQMAQRFSANADGSPAGAIDSTNSNKASEAKRSEIPGEGAIAGGSGKYLPSDDAIKSMEDRKYNNLDDIRQLGLEANSGFASALESVNSFADLFRGRSELWGKEAPQIGTNLNAYAANVHGVQSTQLAEGIKDLATISHSDINRLFTDLNSDNASVRLDAAERISRMNDASQFLGTKEGASAAFDAFNSEDGGRLARNDAMFNTYLGVRNSDETPLSQELFNQLSQTRMSGQLTDDNASMVLKALTGNALNENTLTPGDISRPELKELVNLESAQALSWTLNSEQSNFSGTESASFLRDTITGSTSANRDMAYLAPEPDKYRDIARDNIVRDASQSTLIASTMNEQGEFRPGYNFTPDQQNVDSAPHRYVSGLLNSNDSVENYNTTLLNTSVGEQPTSILQRVFGGDSGKPSVDQQEQLFTAVSAPYNHSQRLDQAGFSYEAERVREGTEDLRTGATAYGITVNQAELTQNLNDKLDQVKDLPSIDAYVGNRKP
ncbi:conjugal transfer protein TraG N-terminal domain-containing protein [Rheinheimera sp.]|uniref:conjugal transfer protein TraG N-terminal domain-containing protein n=1 Tax=Rheinheimera sp. TaxID=1869214 RepID=UPI0040480423